MIGPCTFKLLRNLLTPEKPGEKLHADLVNVLTDHFSPKPLEIVQRSKFYENQTSQYQNLWQNCICIFRQH